jgi:prepilin-type N-terminal cleavage/methylation domain-containing protein
VGRAAYTLLEMLLVLAVVAIILAIAWPNVTRLSSQQRLTDGAEKVRKLVASARVHAVDSGLVYQFRYEPGGRYFVVVPFEREFEAVGQDAREKGTASGLGRFSRAAGTLPEGVVFAAPTLMDPTGSNSARSKGMGQKLAPEMFTGLPNASKLEMVSWSGPVLFEPNGTAADATLDLIDQRNQRITLQIRGVTGAVGVGRVRPPERP